MNSSADLTIVLPLKDRVAFTRRWLAYAVSAPLQCRVLIADGGADQSVAALAQDARASGVEIEYRRYPYDETYGHYYAKIADALSRVTTPFVVMADNDDFFMPEGLHRAVAFLNAHPDFVACGGQCAVFWVNGEQQIGAPYGDRVEWKCSSQYSTDTAESAAQRLRERCLGANDVFYAVHRTALLRSNFEAVRDCNPRDLFLMEQLVMFLTAIAGKTRQLDTLYIARQQGSPDRSGGEHQRRFGGWFERMLAPTWSDDFTRFADYAAAALVRADRIDEPAARRVVVDAYKASVAPSLLSDLVEEPTVSWSMPIVLQLVRRLVNLPRHSWRRRLAQSAYRRAHWLSHDFVRGTEIKTARARDAAGEFSPVKAFLTADQNSRTSGT
jgi:glycosyltransferase domain-containing protein